MPALRGQRGIDSPLGRPSIPRTPCRRVRDYKGALAYMRADSAKRAESLAAGVGNDMNGPFYTQRSAYKITYWPNGISNGLVTITAEGGKQLFA
jgi:hypothetical protein